MKKWLTHHFLWILPLVLATYFILRPLIKPGFIITDDADWMVVRLSAFYQSLFEGQFPVRFLGRLNQSYGYPVANFLYPGFMYLGSILHLFGFPFQTAIEIIIGGSVGVGAIFIYLWLQTQFSSFSSAIGAVSFLFTPYFLYDVYKRGSVGELLAIACASASLFFIEKKQKLFTPLCIGLLAISHNTLALFFLPFLLGYILVKKQYSMLLPYIYGVGMSLFFWAPAILEQSFVNFGNTVISNPKHFFQISTMLLLETLPLFMVALLSFAFKQKKHEDIKKYFAVILIVVGIFTSAISAFIWNITPFAQVIQFPYRWLSYICLLGPWYIAYVSETKQLLKIVTIGVIGYFCYLSVPYQKVESILRPEGYFTTNEASTTVADEYMPRWVSKRYEKRPDKKIDFYKGSGTIYEKKVNSQVIDVIVDAKEESVLQINALYYPGWGGMLDNETLKINSDNVYGVMRITVSPGIHHLYMAFRETAFRLFIDLVSAAFFVLFIVSVVGEYMFRKKKR